MKRALLQQDAGPLQQCAQKKKSRTDELAADPNVLKQQGAAAEDVLQGGESAQPTSVWYDENGLDSAVVQLLGEVSPTTQIKPSSPQPKQRCVRCQDLFDPHDELNTCRMGHESRLVQSRFSASRSWQECENCGHSCENCGENCGVPYCFEGTHTTDYSELMPNEDDWYGNQLDEDEWASRERPWH